jgi:hypothetical protein
MNAVVPIAGLFRAGNRRGHSFPQRRKDAKNAKFSPVGSLIFPLRTGRLCAKLCPLRFPASLREIKRYVRPYQFRIITLAITASGFSNDSELVAKIRYTPEAARRPR